MASPRFVGVCGRDARSGVRVCVGGAPLEQPPRCLLRLLLVSPWGLSRGPGARLPARHWWLTAAAGWSTGCDPTAGTTLTPTQHPSTTAGDGTPRASDLGCEPIERAFGCGEVLRRHSGKPPSDALSIDEIGIEKRCHEVLVLLAEGAELGDA